MGDALEHARGRLGPRFVNHDRRSSLAASRDLDARIAGRRRPSS
jgi:hypothetical protein